MSSAEKITISPEEKSRIAKLFETFNKNPQSLTDDDRSFLSITNDNLWKICKDNNESYDSRSAVFGFIEMCHKILGRNFNKDWAPREPKKSGGKPTPWIATKEQRTKNSNELIDYLKTMSLWDTMSPFEQSQVIAKVWGTVKT